ncbi:MAG: vWA domain-containing protein [Sphingobium sp.]
MPPRPQPPAQSGLLTAGDHDDLLNPELYADYAEHFLQESGQRDLPFVDTRKRVAVKVVDAGGRPVPFARVDVQRGGSPLRLVAAADGTASFYPAFDRVPARTTVRVASAAGNAARALDLGGRGARSIAIALPGTAPAVSAMDLALVIDTTGSMGDEMAYLQAEIDSIVARLKREAGNLDLRISVIVYRDEGDDYVVRSTPLTADIRSVRATLARQEAGGGGDMPEAVAQAMAAAERMEWRPGAAKAILLVADAPPHEEDFGPTLASTERLRARGVQIVPVAASGVEESAEYVMRTMAALTQGRYIFLTDDSGVGNPHAEPNLACYAVTRLDQLIGRVLAGIAEGRRIEPQPGEVIRIVGNYDRGRCLGAGVTPRQG